mgnify:CR=1 FL=1
MEKACCQQYEVDYKKVVQEIQEILYHREQDLINEIKTQLNPLKYLELTAQLREVRECYNTLLEFKEYLKKPIQVENDNKVVEYICGLEAKTKQF